METTAVERWLYGLLAGDATLAGLVGDRIYAYVAPLGAALPLVVFAQQAGTDVRVVGPGRLMAALLYQVRAVGPGPSAAVVAPVAARLDALLQGASGSVVDGVVLGCTREQPLSYVETEGGESYRHLGGIYRIWAQ